MMHYLRQWDVVASNRVDGFIAPSSWIALCIQRAYRRGATVIYPPVDVEDKYVESKRDDFFITISRLEPHKQVDLIVQAFNRLGLPLIVIGDGREYRRISSLARSNVQLMGHQPDDVIHDLLHRAKGYVQAAEDDFGITAVEAQAAGCPVIAYASGGVLETVIDGKTGFFYPNQAVDSLVAAIEQFQGEYQKFNGATIRQNAQRFSKKRFQDELAGFIDQKWIEFSKNSVFIKP